MSKTRLLSIFKWGFITGLFIALCAALFIFIFIMRSTRDLPSLETLSNYKPQIMTRVHAGDGKLIEEFAEEQRVFISGHKIPDELKHAFIAAEDQRFYTHKGWDPIGLTRAALQAPMRKLSGRRIGGTSTITQQVAKNFIVGDDYSIRRKIREIAIARRMEKALDKEQIIELYLNEIYFGRRSYGVAAASLNYFGKPLNNLSLAEMTYLGALPKGPNNYRLDEERGRERAASRQSYILGRMVEDGYITQTEADRAKQEKLEWITRFDGQEYLAADYFVEEARKEIFDLYGEDELYAGGLSIRTTLDTQMQLAGRKALRGGLEAYDRRRGYRGPLAHFDDFSDWKKRLAEFKAPADIAPWRVALVRKADKNIAELSFADETAQTAESTDDAVGVLPFKELEWAAKALTSGKKDKTPESTADVLKAGDLILVEALSGKNSKTNDGVQSYGLRQIPDVNGGLIAMDPHTGRVLALVGGYSFNQSQYNRATQAKRQPGSAFKPFVYAAALENEFTPSSQVLDAPFVIARNDADKCDEADLALKEAEANGLRNAEITDPEAASEVEDCERFYKPSNFSEGRWYGLSTLRLGLEKSRNAMTVRLASDIGMSPIKRIGERVGIYDDVKPELAWSLGAGETTLLRLAKGYSVLVNGGKDVNPRIIDRVQNRAGETIYLHGETACEICVQDEWQGQAPPQLDDDREDLMDPITAYQVTYMLKGVVDNGTGRSISVLGRPLGGKTGTTNDFKDGWFMGFSPDLVAGVYVGYDTPRSLANESGGKVAAPIFRDFMGDVLKGKPKVPFRIPEGITLAPVNRDTGEPSFIGAPNYILEAYRSGTEPGLSGFGSSIRVGGDSYAIGANNTSGDNSTDFYDLDYGFEDGEEDINAAPEEADEGNEEEGSEAPALETTATDLPADDSTNEDAGVVLELREVPQKLDNKTAIDLSGESQPAEVADKVNLPADGIKPPLSEADKLKKAAAEALKKKKEGLKKPGDGEEELEDDQLEDGLY